MFKKANDFTSGLKMTIVAGIFLVGSLIAMLIGIEMKFDLAWITIIISGYPLLYLAITRLINEKWVSSALLISIAMIASISIGELFAAGEVAFIMAIGAVLEDHTVNRAKRGLSKLLSLMPVEGRKLIAAENGGFKEEMIPAEKIKKDDLLRILPGEKIPVDGLIINGQTSVDQSVITGESLPIDKENGDELYCGTINCSGSVDMRATKVGEDSSLQKLINLIEDAEHKKAPMQRTVDKWAVWLVPIALVVAVTGFAINWMLGYEILEALNRAVTVLVVFCPCALALATPVSIIAAIGQAAKNGVVIKSGEALENMGKVNHVVLDKTGTLTTGTLEVSDIVYFEGYKEEQVLRFAASAESKSEHPIGKAIVKSAKKRSISMLETDEFQMMMGKGISTAIDGKRILCGNERYFSEHEICILPEAESALSMFRKQGKISILVSVNEICIGVVALADVLRSETKNMIAGLAETNTEVSLLTGDNAVIASYLATQVGIKQVYAELLPNEKVEKIQLLQAEGEKVCMVGDGINDAAALKIANVGVAMGSIGSDIAVDAADIALMGDDISKIIYLKKLSVSTLATIKRNITASMCINAVAVTLSVIGVLNPITGALVHNAGSVLVVLNAALLYDRNFEKNGKRMYNESGQKSISRSVHTS